MILDAFLQATIARGSSDVPMNQEHLYRTVRPPIAKATLGNIYIYIHLYFIASAVLANMCSGPFRISLFCMAVSEYFEKVLF